MQGNLEKLLKKVWGYDAFRPLQKEIIESVLAGHDTLGILPTGGGKSLTFQVPGLMTDGLVIIVTPLISLMKDQVDNLRKRRVQAVYVHSGMTYPEKKRAMERVLYNNAKFLYISPERINNISFIRDIQRLKVSLIVVDEAHCISQWGHDFRPSYLKIKRLREIFKNAPILALTASATSEVEEDIVKQLQFRPGFRKFRGSVRRDNLKYDVRRSDSKLYDIYNEVAKAHGSCIVYVRSRKKTKEIAEYLCNMGVEATYYHAGLAPEMKEERQNRWKDNEIPVMVATNAFGMGINKEDVRLVVHYDMPPSLEEYYQEAGRAGRDGKEAHAILLVRERDKEMLRRRVEAEFPPRDTIKQIYSLACIYSRLSVGEGFDRTIEFDLPTFCRTYALEEKTVRPALRILSQAGYVDFIEEFENSSRLTVTTDRDDLYHIKLSSPAHEKLLTSILRKYPGLFSDYVFINEKDIAYSSQLPASDVYQKLVELSKAKIIDYIPRRKTPVLYFPTSMEEERYLLIGTAVYEDRIDILVRRIEAMIDYAFSEGECRTGLLMDYFGEGREGDCCGCDVCRENNNSWKNVVTKKDFTKYVCQILEQHPEGMSNQELSAYVKHFDDGTAQLRFLAHEGVIEFDGEKWHLA